MDIPGIRIQPLSLTNAGTEARARLACQVGEILQATVVVSRAGELTLEMGGTRVQAQSSFQFVPGQHLRLQVIEEGEVPVLRLLGDRLTSLEEIQGRALRMAIPQQGPLAPVLAELAHLASAAKTARPSRHTVSSIAAEILARLPHFSDLGDVEGLKQAVQESGLFLEAHLAAQTPDTHLQADLKADLLRLAAAASEEDGSGNTQGATTFQHAIQGALARLEVNQINWLGEGMLALELPIRTSAGAETLSLIFEKGEEVPDGQGGVQRPWIATLRFTLDGLGSMMVRVAVAREVSVFFQTEHSAASRILGSRLDELRTALTNAGLTPGRLTAQTGETQTSRPWGAKLSRPTIPLLDVLV